MDPEQVALGASIVYLLPHGDIRMNHLGCARRRGLSVGINGLMVIAAGLYALSWR